MKIAIAAGLFLAATPFMALAAESPKPESSLGACVWNNLPSTVRSDYVKAYGKTGPTGAAPKVLQAADGQIKAQMITCSGRANVPPLWVEGAVSGQAIQAGALAALAPAGIDRARLMTAWEAAPALARACTMAFAAKVYSMQNPPACSTPDTILAFLPLVGIPDFKARVKDGAQVFAFYNGLSQTLWTEQFIGAMPVPTP